MARSARRFNPRLQGVSVLYPLATATIGLSKSASPKPTARSIARLGVRSTPSVMTRLLVLLLITGSWLEGCRASTFERSRNVPVRLDINWMKPIPVALVPARGSCKEDLLDLFGHWTTCAVTYRSHVNLGDRCHFHGRAGEEGLVSGKQVINLERPDFHLAIEIARNPHHRIPCDARQNAVTVIVGQQLSTTYEEQIFPGSFGQMTICVQKQGFSISTTYATARSSRAPLFRVLRRRDKEPRARGEPPLRPDNYAD